MTYTTKGHPSVQITEAQPSNNGAKFSTRKSISVDPASANFAPSKRHNITSVQLTPIPGSPNASDASAPPSIASPRSVSESRDRLNVPQDRDSPGRRSLNERQSREPDSPTRPRAKSTVYTSVRAQQPQSLAAALEILSTSHSDGGQGCIGRSFIGGSTVESGSNGYATDTPSTPSKRRVQNPPPSPSRPIPETPKFRPTVGGKAISGPILNPSEAIHKWGLAATI